MPKKIPFLMIPGPTEASPEVLSWMGKPLIAHYGSEWVEIFNEILELIRKVFQTKNDVFMMPGSGTTGLDSAIKSCFSQGEKVLVIVNGSFGENLARMANLYELDVLRVEAPLGELVALEKVEEALKKYPDVRGITCAHIDTMAGICNQVRELSKIAQERDILFIDDAITAVGGTEVPVDEWGIDICVTASQKCLEAPPGLALISVSPKAWRAMENRSPKKRGWYFDLLNWRKITEEWADWHPHPSTMPCSIALALRQSLLQILEEGLENRIRRHRQIARMVREGLSKLGFAVPPHEYAANTVTTAYTPDGIEPDEILTFIREHYDTQISKILGKTELKAIRLGHMGQAATLRAVVPVLFGIEDFLRQRGYSIPVGASLEAVSSLSLEEVAAREAESG